MFTGPASRTHAEAESSAAQCDHRWRSGEQMEVHPGSVGSLSCSVTAQSRSSRPGWLPPSLHPSSSLLHLPAALFPPPSLTADAVSGALENKGWRTSAPHSCVCVRSFHPAELYCFVISSSLLLSARCRFCSVFPWDHSQSSRQSNCAVEHVFLLRRVCRCDSDCCS